MELIQQIDTAILLFIQNHMRIETWNGFWGFITSLADKGWFWVTVSILLLVPKKTRMAGIASLVSLALCFGVTNVILKEWVARPRPYNAVEAIVPLIKGPRDYSFPSGHTTASFASALVFFRLLPRKYGIPAVCLAGLIGFSRLYLGVHYPSDVLGGFLVAWAGSACAVSYILPIWGRMRKNGEEKKKDKL